MKALCCFVFMAMSCLGISSVSGTDIQSQDSPITRGESVSLREYFDTRLQYMDREIREANRLMEARLDGFPAQFMKKGESEYSSAIGAINGKIETLFEFKNRSEGMATQKEMDIVKWISILSLIIGLAGMVLRLKKRD